MPTHRQEESSKQTHRQFWRAALLASAAFSFATPAIAQENADAPAEAAADNNKRLDTIVVTGIRQSLATALEEKRTADSLIEVINAEDIGKLPDQNLAEVLEN